MEDTANFSVPKFMGTIARYITPYRWQFLVGVFFRFTSDMARLYPAWAISQIVAILSRPGTMDTHSIVNIFVTWTAVSLYFGAAHNFSKYHGFQVSEKASLDLYQECLAHVFQLDYAWQETENSGNKLKRIDKGMEGLNLAIRRIFNVLIEVLVNTTGIVLIFLTLSPWLSVALVLFIITYFILGTTILKKAVAAEKLVNKEFENLGGLTYEALNNIQTIKALSIDHGINQAITNQIRSMIGKIRQRIYYYQLQNGALLTYEVIFQLAVVSTIVVNIVHGTAQLSLLVLFVGLFEKISESAHELTDVTQELTSAKVRVGRAMAILATQPVIEHPGTLSAQSTFPSGWNRIQLAHVNFAYRKKTTLKDISFTIQRGEKVGIVGLSGAGKSTLFKLLLDLYENYTGDIFIDSIPLKNINRRSYIDHVAVVLQDTELFDMTLRENIQIAAVPNQPLPDLTEVLRMAHLDQVAAHLPQGVDSVVGEKGIRLSGGQRQRVGIARALYRQPDILLLDEATSHLDAHSEKEIQQALEETMHQFTTIVIAHRLSTIRAMDRIIVMDQGRIVELGTFEELLARPGPFARMWQEQKL